MYFPGLSWFHVLHGYMWGSCLENIAHDKLWLHIGYKYAMVNGDYRNSGVD